MAETMVAAPAAARRVALFMDGTWNTRNDATNVWRMYSLGAGLVRTGKPRSPTTMLVLEPRRGKSGEVEYLATGSTRP